MATDEILKSVARIERKLSRLANNLPERGFAIYRAGLMRGAAMSSRKFTEAEALALYNDAILELDRQEWAKRRKPKSNKS